MKFKLSAEVQDQILRYYKHNTKLSKKIQKQLTIFSSNHLHPSLRTHKLSGKMSSSWSISIDRSIRMVYSMLSNDLAYFYMIGTHDEVYRK